LSLDVQLYAKFNGGVTDSSGNARDGQASGSPAAAYVAGRYGRGIELIASQSNAVDFGNDVGIGGVAAFSLECWYKPLTSTPDFASLFSKFGGVSDRVELSTGGSGAGSATGLLFIVANTQNTYGHTAGSLLALNTWAHIVAVYDGAGASNALKMQIYVNGVSRALTFSAGTFPATAPALASSPLKTGRAGAFTQGVLDEYYVYSQALTAAQVRTRYGVGGLPNPVINPIVNPIDNPD
jgi:hypothetical protein